MTYQITGVPQLVAALFFELFAIAMVIGMFKVGISYYYNTTSPTGVKIMRFCIIGMILSALAMILL